MIDAEIYYMETFDGQPCGIAGLTKYAAEINASTCMVMPNPEDYRPNNHELHDAIKDRSDLLGVAGINPHYGQEMLDEVRMAAAEWDFRGIKFMPLKQDFVCTDSILKPYMDLARELKLYVTIHTGPYESLPINARPLAAAYPDVPILLDHMGMRSWVGQAIDLAKTYSNVYLLTTVIAAAEPFRVRMAVNALGPERVIFGSNSPTSIPAMNAEGIRRLELGKEAEALIFHENAKRVLGI